MFNGVYQGLLAYNPKHVVFEACLKIVQVQAKRYQTTPKTLVQYCAAAQHSHPIHNQDTANTNIGLSDWSGVETGLEY